MERFRSRDQCAAGALPPERWPPRAAAERATRLPHLARRKGLTTPLGGGCTAPPRRVPPGVRSASHVRQLLAVEAGCRPPPLRSGGCHGARRKGLAGETSRWSRAPAAPITVLVWP